MTLTDLHEKKELMRRRLALARVKGPAPSTCASDDSSSKLSTRPQSGRRTVSQLRKDSKRRKPAVKAPLYGKVKSLYSEIKYAAKGELRAAYQEVPCELAGRASPYGDPRTESDLRSEPELRPHIPAPWTKLDHPGQRARAMHPFGAEGEEGEIPEAILMEPNYVVEKIGDVSPNDPKMKEYIHELRRKYFKVKEQGMREILFRERFKNENFQALVSDYLADCQMQRDRGEITDHLYNNLVSNVTTLLFGGQMEVQTQHEAITQELDNMYQYCLDLQRNPRQSCPVGVKERIALLREPSEESYYMKMVRHLVDTQASNINKVLASHFGPSASEDALRARAAKFKVFDGVRHIPNRDHDERMRLTRALDQRVSPGERLFEGKITSFTEARLTDCSSHGDMDQQLLKSHDPIVRCRASESESDGPAEVPDMEKRDAETHRKVKEFERKRAMDRSRASLRRTRYEPQRNGMVALSDHLLFGKVRKFKGEQVCFSEDSPFHEDESKKREGLAQRRLKVERLKKRKVDSTLRIK